MNRRKFAALLGSSGLLAFFGSLLPKLSAKKIDSPPNVYSAPSSMYMAPNSVIHIKNATLYMTPGVWHRINFPPSTPAGAISVEADAEGRVFVEVNGERYYATVDVGGCKIPIPYQLGKLRRQSQS